MLTDTSFKFQKTFLYNSLFSSFHMLYYLFLELLYVKPPGPSLFFLFSPFIAHLFVLFSYLVNVSFTF